MEMETYSSDSNLPSEDMDITSEDKIEKSATHQPASPSIENELAKYVSFFESPDSIMDPTLLSKMRAFLSLEGQPQTVVKALIASYRGYAQTSNLLAHWLKASGLDSAEVYKLTDDHLKKVVLHSFDPKKADSIFGEAFAPPIWLESMIKQPDWRAVIYQLAETQSFRNCLMLNFAIQRISDEGHQTEIASLTTASTFFSVFNKVLKDSIENLLQLDELTLGPALDDFKKMCCHSQHTYLYAQLMLQALMKEKNGGSLKRISQELEQEIVTKGRITQAIGGVIHPSPDYLAVASSIAAMAATNSTNPSDIMKLYTLYSGNNPPSVEFLRLPLLFDLLIKDLFNPGKTINPTYKSKYLFVLAYAATMDAKKSGEAELKTTLKALEIVQPICQRNSYGSELQASIGDLKENISFPVVAMGILQWIRFNLTDPEYYATSYNTLCVPIHLELLRELSSKHVLLRPQIMDLLSISFEMKTSLDALAALEMKRSLLDNIIFLMQCGYVLPVMVTVERWAQKTDQSLIRYFIVQVLDMIEPPYSHKFLSSLLRIIERPGTIEALKSLKVQEKKDVVLSQMIEHCIATDYGWDASQLSSLNKLKEVFGGTS
eukprot:TRINITY_DN5391_c0_g1_i1.p1 TRINITY_DN5391_c0_g1~~TRINITY_DN5391_c0_g1_i1.p1  ORF type:complete len:603 (+),score=146.86 TRINITY_DN5391_c0_g1_i1:116-1924(+)